MLAAILSLLSILHLPFDVSAVTARPGSAVKDGLQLRVTTLQGGPIRGGGQLVTVGVELKNVGAQPLRVVWEPSGPQPLVLIVDGERHWLPAGISTAALLGWTELPPGATLATKLTVGVGVGTRTVSWRYVVDKGPYGRPLPRCWTGTIETAPLAVEVPVPFDRVDVAGPK